MNMAWPWAKSSAWYTGRSENPPGPVAASAGPPAVVSATALAMPAIHQERPSLRMGGSLTFGAAKIESLRRLSYPRVQVRLSGLRRGHADPARVREMPQVGARFGERRAAHEADDRRPATRPGQLLGDLPGRGRAEPAQDGEHLVAAALVVCEQHLDPGGQAGEPVLVGGQRFGLVVGRDELKRAQVGGQRRLGE